MNDDAYYDIWEGITEDITEAYREVFSKYSNEERESIFQKCMRHVDGTTDIDAGRKYKASMRIAIYDTYPKSLDDIVFISEDFNKF